MYKTDKDRYNQLAKDWTHKYAMQPSVHDHSRTLLVSFQLYPSSFLWSTHSLLLLVHCACYYLFFVCICGLLGDLGHLVSSYVLADCSNISALYIRSTFQAVVGQVIERIESTFAAIYSLWFVQQHYVLSILFLTVSLTILSSVCQLSSQMSQ